jgi:hypothetical protein
MSCYCHTSRLDDIAGLPVPQPKIFKNSVACFIAQGMKMPGNDGQGVSLSLVKWTSL